YDDAAANRIGCSVRCLDDRDEDPQHKRRHQDTRQSGKRGGGVGAHRALLLLQEEAEFHRRVPPLGRGASSAAVSRFKRSAKSPVVSSWAYRPVASSRMMRPRRNSITRRRILSPSSLSCVAPITVVPARLMR